MRFSNPLAGISNPFAKKGPCCGIDLGTGWAKLVRLSARSGKAPGLDFFGRFAWEKEEREQPQATGKRLATFWSGLGLKDKVGISSMAGRSVIIKRITLEVTDAKEVADIIHRDAKQHIPFDISEVFLDFHILEGTEKKRKMDVLLVASKMDMVIDLETAFEKSGIGLSIVDVDAFALSNCFEFNYPEYGEGCTYLVDIGAKQSIFCVYAGKQPIFFREVSFGGQQITDSLAREMEIPAAQAEMVKINGPDPAQMSRAAKAGGAVEETVARWGNELQRLISFYRGNVQDAPVGERLLVSGGGSLLDMLPEVLGQEMKLPVERLDPWKKMYLDPGRVDVEYAAQTASQYVVPTGLALRSLFP